MGAINSKISKKNQTNSLMGKKDLSIYSTLSNPRISVVPIEPKAKKSFLGQICHRVDVKKRKVLILGLDGAGKSKFFTKLIQHYKQIPTYETLPRPTIGYNVETIKIRHHHICHHSHDKLTLWDCGGESSIRSAWSYHYSNTSLLLWLINAHDRSRLDASLHLLSQILSNPLLYRVPVLIVLYHSPSDQFYREESDESDTSNLLTNLEVAFRFLATISSSRASTFQWQVINVTLETDSRGDFKKIEHAFRNLMEL